MFDSCFVVFGVRARAPALLDPPPPFQDLYCCPPQCHIGDPHFWIALGWECPTLHINFHVCIALGWECPTGRFLFKDFWTHIVFWPDTCLVELTMSYVQFQSPLLSSKVFCSVPKSSVQFQSLVTLFFYGANSL